MPPPSRFGRKRKAKQVFGDGDCVQPAPPKPYVSTRDETDVPEFASVGATVKCIGWHGGTHKLFTAIVRGVRARFPRIVVEYVADEHGNTLALALPRPKMAYVHAGMLSV